MSELSAQGERGLVEGCGLIGWSLGTLKYLPWSLESYCFAAWSPIYVAASGALIHLPQSQEPFGTLKKSEFSGRHSQHSITKLTSQMATFSRLRYVHTQLSQGGDCWDQLQLPVLAEKCLSCRELTYRKITEKK